MIRWTHLQKFTLASTAQHQKEFQNLKEMYQYQLVPQAYLPCQAEKSRDFMNIA
jgi:hypothetical protein